MIEGIPKCEESTCSNNYWDLDACIIYWENIKGETWAELQRLEFHTIWDKKVYFIGSFWTW